jgi:hypothetical protein
MGHDHSVPQSSYPRRRHPGFQSNPATRYPAENLLHCLRACCQFLFQKYFPRSFQNVESTRSIQAHSQSLPFNFFDRTCRCGGNLLHCRSPLSSMTWSVSHSAGDRSSHPSVQQLCPQEMKLPCIPTGVANGIFDRLPHFPIACRRATSCRPSAANGFSRRYIITLDGSDVGWLQIKTQDDGLFVAQLFSIFEVLSKSGAERFCPDSIPQ